MDGPAEKPDTLALLDELIAQLTAVIDVPEDPHFRPLPGAPHRRATWQGILRGAARDRSGQSGQAAWALLFDGANLVMRGQSEPARNATVSARVWMGKRARGEAFRVCEGVVQTVRRISGGYEFLIRVTESRREVLSAADHLRECAARKDPLAWQRWCAELTETGVDLSGADLKRASLANFDLCCANLSGADLTGADLSGADLSGAILDNARLDQVRVAGADFFRARMPKAFASLASQAGLMEEGSLLVSD